MIYGRDRETARLAEVLGAVTRGRGAALVVHGEAGIGKSALLAHLAGLAEGTARVLRVTGTEAEVDLPFAALHALLHPLRDRVDTLPAPQAGALRAAFGLAAAPAGHDRFLTGLAVLTLLAEAAEERPVVCLADDAQWLDQASAEALLFAARRLQAEGVAVVFAVRDGDRPFPAAGLPELVLQGLDETQSAAVLGEHGGELAPAVRDRLVADSAGNPLTLIELARSLGPEQRAGKLPPLGWHTEASSPLGRVENAFRERVGALPDGSRTLLTVAAADGTGDLALVVRAAATLGAGVADLEPAEHAGLVRVEGELLVFRHPLVKAAAYRGAALARRQNAHRALAAALGPGGDDEAADRRAQHLAAATTGTDEPLGYLVEQAADRAARRGAPAVAATAHERAAQLTEDHETRARRLVRAAVTAAEAGQLARAGALAERGARLATDPGLLAELAGVRAAWEFELGNAAAAGRIAVDAVGAIAVPAPEKATAMLGDAAAYAYLAGDVETVQHARRLMTAVTTRHPELAGAVFAGVQGCALLLAGDHRGAFRLLRTTWTTPGSELLFRLFTTIIAGADREGAVLADEFVRYCRDHGRIGELTHALQIRTQLRILHGRHAEAEADGAEALHIAEATGHARRAGHLRGILALVAAIEGDEARCAARAGQASGVAAGEWWGEHARGVLALGRGDHPAAVRHLTGLLTGPGGHTAVGRSATPSLVEALVRVGEHEAAAGYAARFRDWAEAGEQAWALELTHRCHALLAPAAEAEPHYLRALAHHEKGTRPFEQARTLLGYGEWLRRARRRADAATRLRMAADLFDRLGAAPWLARAEHELAAIGARPRTAPRQAAALDALTAQEAQVVRLAATGATNRAIAAQLFLSPRTVGYHLYNAFPKLGVTSRAELARFVAVP
ncbi:helix-turn-helix transcriptional regulator [Amycolatopsis sp. lyj-23]|uniref:helix-turn-helix transcriptional regulator n=1 Tax=Amycolatopsis sp. lyj-23 TaxID=2789283 RepID=UPI00397B8D09